MADCPNRKTERITMWKGIPFADCFLFIEIQQFYVFRVAPIVFDGPVPIIPRSSLSKSELGYGALVVCCYLLLQ